MQEFFRTAPAFGFRILPTRETVWMVSRPLPQRAKLMFGTLVRYGLMWTLGS